MHNFDLDFLDCSVTTAASYEWYVTAGYYCPQHRAMKYSPYGYSNLVYEDLNFTWCNHHQMDSY